MPKLTLNPIASGFATNSVINDNFDAIEAALEKTLSRDGTTPNQMTADLDMNGFSILNNGAILAQGGDGFIWEGTWVTSTPYEVNNLVYSDGSCYICTTDHTSGAFATDLAANKWALLASEGAPGADGASGSGSGDLVSTNNLSDVADVTTARGNLSAAKSGANSDITSLSGLTTALSVAQGGTASTTAQAAINTLSAISAATAGQVLTKAGSNASWATPTGGGTGDTNNEYTFPGVADFVQGPGAVFVSGTDNTAAILTAAATGKPIYFPAGDYYAASWSAVEAIYNSRMCYGPGKVYSPYSGKIMNVGKTLMIGSTNSGHRVDYAGGVVIGGERDGHGLRHWVGHHNWMQINATREGVGTQWQLYPGTYNGLARCSSTDTLTATYGTFHSDLLAEDTIAWNGKLYKISSVINSTTITIKDWLTGGSSGAVVDNTYDGTNYTGERMWIVSWETATGTCNVSGTTVTWVSGDHYPYGVAGDQMYAIINGTRYVVTQGPETTGGFTLTLATSPGTLTGATIKFRRQYGPWAYNTLMRLQGLAGGKETNCGFMMNSRNDAVLFNGGTHEHIIGNFKMHGKNILLGGGEAYPYDGTTDNYGIEIVSPSSNSFGDRYVRIGGFNGKESLKVNTWSSYTDHVTIYGSVSGSNPGPTIAAEGSTTNLDLYVNAKGTGSVVVGSRDNIIRLLSEASGSAPHMYAWGSDTNIPMRVSGKGSGGVLFGYQANTIHIFDAASGGTPVIASRGGVGTSDMGFDLPGYGTYRFTASTYAKTILEIYGSNNPDYPTIGNGSGRAVFGCGGGSTDVDIQISPKGAGRIWLGGYTASSDAAVSGYITVKDSGGTVRKLAVIS